MFSKVLLVLSVAAAASAVEYESWKEFTANRQITQSLTAQFEGFTSSVDTCLEQAEGMFSPGDFAAQVRKRGDVYLCQVYKVSKLGTLTVDSMTWDDAVSTAVDAKVAAIHVKKPEEEESHSISDAGLIITIILAIFYIALLVVCVVVCRQEETDISGQMANLEKREMDAEVAVSEHWEKESIAAEEKAAAEERKAIEEVEENKQV